MKTLYLIRHAKSDWSDGTLSDFDRPLNKRGEKNAPLMGKVLSSRGVRPDLILSSPALRARTTAAILAENVGYSAERIVYEGDLYLAEAETIAEVLRNLPSPVQTVFLIGHNPGLTLFAEYITGRAIGNIPTCGIAEIVFDSEGATSLSRGSATLASFDYPKNHPRHQT